MYIKWLILLVLAIEDHSDVQEVLSSLYSREDGSLLVSEALEDIEVTGEAFLGQSGW